MDETEALVAIHTLRIHPAYQQAERLRRKTKGGAAAMAAASEDSEEFAAIHLLLSTWEVIATIMESVASKDRIFEVTPVCHMHNHLKDALSGVSLKHAKLKSPNDFDVPNGGYAAKFTKLANDYHGWMIGKQQSSLYISGACDGMYACFG
jgi:hypothetical protein